ncbi:hypothetical protein PQO03_21695 [Lentisphaera profundi]|uniref:Uncharacterized protein n=1 Tax=Lentisphaera profundi TaxID=1658616 RepID=A0ABY7W2B4_9BACT|nr:hypothetical protein [Lentisphaera profundi]WDE98428.1 hypothetical protein PQO03_21695 [Lentisphaera profundi]
MRFKPFFVKRHRAALSFPKHGKRQPRKKRLIFKLGKLKAKRLKSLDSSMKKKFSALIIICTLVSLIFPPAFYLCSLSLGICFIAACGKALFYKNEKQYTVTKR